MADGRFCAWLSTTASKPKPAKLCMLGDGTIAWKDEIPKGAPVAIVKERDSNKRVVMWRKCTGVDVLEEREIPGRFIPVFRSTATKSTSTAGDPVGVVRWAKDPQRMYNYWMTAATEEVSLRPKTPFIGAEGQFEGYETQWAQANNRSFAFLQYKPTTVDGLPVPPPARQPMADLPSGVLAMAMHANDKYQGDNGIFDASLGVRGNETSGKSDSCASA